MTTWRGGPNWDRSVWPNGVFAAFAEEECVQRNAAAVCSTGRAAVRPQNFTPCSPARPVPGMNAQTPAHNANAADQSSNRC
jgi:hypothetical protein